MPIEYLWVLVVSLIVLSIGVSLKLARALFSLKLMHKEFDRFIREIASINDKRQKTISSISKLRKTEIEKIINTYDNAIDKAINKIPHDKTLQSSLIRLWWKTRRKKPNML